MKYSKQIVIAISIGIIHLLCNVGQAATILIDGNGTEFENSSIFVISDIGRAYIGNVGDYFSLNTGNHRIGIEGPRDYTYLFMVIVQPGDVQIKDHKTDKFEGDIYEISWEKPTVSLKSKENNTYEIKLTNPVFGEFINKVMVGFSMLTPVLKHAILNVTSNPIGGEIWVDGKNSGVRTNSALSVPFNEEKQTVPVVVRMTGRVNSKKEVSVTPNANLNVHFDLLEP